MKKYFSLTIFLQLVSITGANFSIPWPLCSRVRPDVRDRQTDVRHRTDVRRKKKHRLMPPHHKLFGMPTQHPCKLTFDFLTLKVVSESRVTWATSVPYFSLPRPLCSRLRSDARDRQTDVRRASSLYASYPRGGGIISEFQFL